MPIESIQLPDDPKTLAVVIDNHVKREVSRLAYRRMVWTLASWYMQGVRNVTLLNPNQGTIRFKWTDDDGKMEFQSGEMLQMVDKTMGKLASLDLRPMVRRTGMSLPGIRERAVGQVLADSLISEQQLNSVKTQFAFLFTLLGSVGITGHLNDHPTIGLNADLEVVHPMEMMPFPSVGTDYTKQQGYVRRRFLPMSYLKKLFGGSVDGDKARSKMDFWTVNAGDSLDRDEETNNLFGGSTLVSGGKPGSEVQKKTSVEVAELRELWTWGPGMLLNRYAVTSGELTLEDQKLDGVEVYPPIGWARFMENGTFHGLGLFDLMFPLVREAESLTRQLFSNIKSIDRYGVLVLPHGSFNKNTMLRDVGDGLRVFPWEPDPISEGFRPFAVQPFNSGEIPGKTAQFALDQIDRMSPIRDLLREKGRVDSAVGLSFLDEQINSFISTPASGIDKSFGDCYRAIVSNGARVSLDSKRPIPVERITQDLAGAVIDTKEMTVSFENNPIPNISKLVFGVKQTAPNSGVARKQEALQMQQTFQLDLNTFMLFAMKEGLDFALWSDDYVGAFELVTRNIVSLYGNGEESGQIIVVPQMSKPELQLQVLAAFMGSPTMAVASDKVQNAFITYHETLLDFMGLTLPQAIPNPDDAALLQQIEQGQQPDGGGGVAAPQLNPPNPAQPQ